MTHGCRVSGAVLVAAVLASAGCSAESGPSCAEFLKKSKSTDYNNPTGYDVLVDAYEAKHPDAESVQVAKIYGFASRVMQGCQQAPDSNVADHLPDE